MQPAADASLRYEALKEKMIWIGGVQPPGWPQELPNTTGFLFRVWSCAVQAEGNGRCDDWFYYGCVELGQRSLWQAKFMKLSQEVHAWMGLPCNRGDVIVLSGWWSQGITWLGTFGKVAQNRICLDVLVAFRREVRGRRDVRQNGQSSLRKDGAGVLFESQ